MPGASVQTRKHRHAHTDTHALFRRRTTKTTYVCKSHMFLLFSHIYNSALQLLFTLILFDFFLTYAHSLNSFYPCLFPGSHPLSAPDLAALVSPLIGGRAQGSTLSGCPLPRHSSACPYKDTAVYPIPFACSDADPQTPSRLDPPLASPL